MMLTREQVEEFEELGYLRVPRALSEERVEGLLAAIGDLQGRSDARDDGLQWWERFHAFDNAGGTSSVWERRNVVADDPRLFELVDLPAILLPMCQLLGPGIALTSSHAVVRMRSSLTPEEAAARPLGWHRDLGVSSLEMTEPHPRLAIKVAIWLTPLTGPGQGAMHVVPGSHRLVGKLPLNRETNRPFGAIEALGDAGDLFFFEQRLWHAGSPNLTDSPRICLFYGYGYRWLRPQDYVAFPEERLDAEGPLRRQLLGGGATQNGYHLPTPDDVPLREWFEEQRASVR